MKIVEEKNEKINLERILEERIINNKDMFTEIELKYMKNNIKLINKIYLLGILDGNF